MNSKPSRTRSTVQCFLASAAIFLVGMLALASPSSAVTFAPQSTLTNSDGASNESFGTSLKVSADGTTAVIGSPNDSVDGIASGSAIVYTRTNGTWTQQQILTAADAANGDNFGRSAAISSDGTTIVVGAPQDSMSPGTHQGSVSIFVRSGSTWNQQATLVKPDGATDDGFGQEVATSGDGSSVLVGTPSDFVGLIRKGSVSHFTRSGVSWSFAQTLLQTGGAADDNFGTSIAMTPDGTTAIIGSPYDSIGAQINQGSVSVFIRPAGTWTSQALLTQPGGTQSDGFGVSVAISSDGNTAIAGANYDKVSGITSQGSATVLSRSGAAWTPGQLLVPKQGIANESFGAAVSLSADGHLAAVGAPGDRLAGRVETQGSVTTFERKVSNYVLQQTAYRSDVPDGEYQYLGNSLSFSSDGETLMASVPGASVNGQLNQGLAIVFERVKRQLNVAKTGSGNGVIASSPSGISCGATCGSSYDDAATVNLTATPNPGSTFTGWSGACSGSGNTCSLSMTDDLTASANFEPTPPPAYQLSVARSGLGSGLVTSQPAGISCGVSCSHNFGADAAVTLTATPEPGSVFGGWSGSCSGTSTQCQLTMDQARSATADFDPAPVQYSLSVSKTGTGSVASSPGGIECGSTCSKSFDEDQTVILSAAPSTGFTFQGWSGDCSGSGSTCSVAMTQVRSVTANFVAVTYELSVEKSGAGSGTVASTPDGISCGSTCSALIPEGTDISLEATPDSNSIFSGWSGACAGSGSTCEIESNRARTVKAIFDLIPAAAAPQVKITSKPAKQTRSTNAVFRFTSSVAGSTFSCKIDSKAFAPCPSPKNYTRLKAGKHSFKVTATAGGRAGNTASYTWKVNR